MVDREQNKTGPKITLTVRQGADEPPFFIAGSILFIFVVLAIVKRSSLTSATDSVMVYRNDQVSFFMPFAGKSISHGYLS